MDSKPDAGKELPVGHCEDATGVITLRHPDGSLVRIRPGVEVFEGDEITTTMMGHTTIKFMDGGKLAINPTTSVKIDRFHWARTPNDLCHITLFHGTLAFLDGKVAHAPDCVIIQAGPMTLNVQNASLICRLSPNGKKADVAMLPGSLGIPGEVLVHNNVAVETLSTPFHTLRIDGGYGYVSKPMITTSNVLLNSFEKAAVGPLLRQILAVKFVNEEPGFVSVFDSEVKGFELFHDLEDRLLERRFLEQFIYPDDHEPFAARSNDLLEDAFDGERFRLKQSDKME